MPRRSRIDFELGERDLGVEHVHGFHAEGARGGDVVGVVVEEDRFAGRDVHARARELVDLAVGFAHPDVGRVDDLFAQLVDREHRAPVVAELLDVVREQPDAQPALLELAHLVHDGPVHARRGLAPEAAVRVHVDRLSDDARRLLDHAFEVGRDVELTLLEEVPVGLVLDLALVLGRVGIGGDRVGDGTALDADVRGVAEEQPQQRPLRG